MHTRQSPAKAGDCGYARPFAASKKKENQCGASIEKLTPKK